MVRTNDCPDDSVEGNVGGTIANPAPDTCAEVTMTGAPDADTITFCVAVVPTCVALKFTVVLFAVIVPAAPAVPLPERATISVEFDALLAIISEPLNCPAVCGSN